MLGKGEVVNMDKLGFNHNISKDQHNKLIAITKDNLMQADQIFRKQWDERDNIHKRVLEENLKAKAKVNNLQI